jgi:glycosyltransferase involved in cell wall biosynthesis
MIRVSVLMPIAANTDWNFIQEAVRSLGRQLFKDFEVCVHIDGSRSDTHEIAECFSTWKINYTITESTRQEGVSAALNEAACWAHGDYIARMDADDVSYPERFAQQISYLDAYPDCVLLGTHVRYIHASGHPTFGIGPKERLWYPGTEHQELDAAHLRCEKGLHHPTIMMKRSAFEKDIRTYSTGGYRSEFEGIEDFDLFLRMAEVGRIHCLPITLLDYRQHDGMVSRKIIDFEEKRKTLRASTLFRRDMNRS